MDQTLFGCSAIDIILILFRVLSVVFFFVVFFFKLPVFRRHEAPLIVQILNFFEESRTIFPAIFREFSCNYFRMKRVFSFFPVDSFFFAFFIASLTPLTPIFVLRIYVFQWCESIFTNRMLKFLTCQPCPFFRSHFKLRRCVFFVLFFSYLASILRAKESKSF